MFQINDTVVYGSQGVCRISGVTQKNFNGLKLDYYILKPVYEDSSTIFVPMKNETLRSRMYKVLSADEILTLIRTMPAAEPLVDADDNTRSDRYRHILAGGDRSEMIRLIKTLYTRRLSKKAVGKSLNLSDEGFLREAEKNLYDEFALVLHVERAHMPEFVMEQIRAVTPNPIPAQS